ncbi:hypothetical protein EZS27_007740 [termite gut metagenome]|uniref:Uncharacterized protein n=1 Tax=termite gut metagenome TaxID=433724 RepID=A0A5J4SHF2_9ZZZZ
MNKGNYTALDILTEAKNIASKNLTLETLMFKTNETEGGGGKPNDQQGGAGGMGGNEQGGGQVPQQVPPQQDQGGQGQGKPGEMRSSIDFTTEINTIRKNSLASITRLADQPLSKEYEFFKKLWNDCDKFMEDTQQQAQQSAVQTPQSMQQPQEMAGMGGGVNGGNMA